MLEVLQWALLSFVVVVIVMIGVLTPWTDLVNEAIRTSAHIQATQIASIINLLQSSPDKTTHSYVLPRAECNVTIGDNVLFRIKDVKYDRASVDIIKTNITIQKFFTECNDTISKGILFIRDGNEIKMREQVG